eukprot:476143-Prorocentrum_minimum.AAC.1
MCFVHRYTTQLAFGFTSLTYYVTCYVTYYVTYYINYLCAGTRPSWRSGSPPPFSLITSPRTSSTSTSQWPPSPSWAASLGEFTVRAREHSRSERVDSRSGRVDLQSERVHLRSERVDS